MRITFPEGKYFQMNNINNSSWANSHVSVEPTSDVSEMEQSQSMNQRNSFHNDALPPLSCLESFPPAEVKIFTQTENLNSKLAICFYHLRNSCDVTNISFPTISVPDTNLRYHVTQSGKAHDSHLLFNKQRTNSTEQSPS
jgi:hypothetical protein